MYCVRMNLRHKCKVNFDPGGRRSKHFVSVVALIVIILQFGDVHSSTVISRERLQRRREFPVPNSTTLRYTFDGPTNADSMKVNDQTGHRKYVLRVWSQPKKFNRQYNLYAALSLSNLLKFWLNPQPKHLTEDYVKPSKHLFLESNDRTRTFSVDVEEGENQYDLMSVEKIEKPDSVHHGDDKDEGEMSWSRPIRVENAGIDDHRHKIFKRDTGMNDPDSAADNSTLNNEEGTPVNPQSDPSASVRADSIGGQEQRVGAASPQPTATLQLKATSQKPEVQPPNPTESIHTVDSISPTTQQQLTPSQQILSPQNSPTTPSQRSSAPNERGKSLPQTSPRPTHFVRDTEEAPTSTDGSIEENGASCEDAQCYASRLPYHWTSDASWALGSMVFLMCVLTFFVLYTGLWKKRNPMSYPLDSSVPPDPHQKINIADLLKTRLAAIPRHLRSKRFVHRKRMNGRRYEELPLHQPNGACNDEELDYFEDEDEDDLYFRDEHTV